jgi:hypothetical protein
MDMIGRILKKVCKIKYFFSLLTKGLFSLLDQSAGTSVHPSQIEMVNQSQNLIDRKPSSQLPNLCEYIKQKLLAQESHLVWTKLIQECAYYYLAHLPRIGLDNSSGDYREIGRNMYDAYPAIARDGTQPWVIIFSLCFVASFFFLHSNLF